MCSSGISWKASGQSSKALTEPPNALGQIILDPVKAVPASEMWLYENPQALASVKRGLRESAEGKSIKYI